MGAALLQGVGRVRPDQSDEGDWWCCCDERFSGGGLRAMKDAFRSLSALKDPFKALAATIVDLGG
jgi:hypothetical protein